PSGVDRGIGSTDHRTNAVRKNSLGRACASRLVHCIAYLYAHVRIRAGKTARAVSIGIRTSPQRRLASGRRVALWRLGDQPALCAWLGAVLRGAKQLLADPGDERADPRGRLGVYADLPDLPGWRWRLHRGKTQEQNARGDRGA